MVTEDQDAAARAMAIGIDRLLVAARSTGHAHEVFELGPTTEWLIDRGREHGLDLTNLMHSADTSAIRSVLKRHGGEAAERAIGQLPIGEVELRSIPAILMSPDQIIFGLSNVRGQDQIAYVKQLADGTTLYIEEVRLGRRKLALASMRRFPGAIADDFLRKSLDPHARSAPRGGPKIIDVPNGGKALEFTVPGTGESERR